ncbi:MAG: hypothetical protein QOI24_1085 [Acidobacteriota bacterium]|jgi:hypothetical protein|nr:hypothetical protein [Acidobacteriota bacterium]
MSDSRRRVVAVAISLFAFLAAATGDAQLRPKVRVLTNSTAPVPPECAEGTVAPPPRAEVLTQAPVSGPPARGGLSTALRVVQQAAERNDYDAFRRSLAAARSATSGYMRGGERDAAQDVLSAYQDLEQVWDFAETTRTGAFYSDENRALTDVARRYGAPAPLHISGQTLYPTHELRELVTRDASKRLARIGIHVTSGTTRRPPTMIAETPRRLPATKVVEAQPSTPPTHSRTHRTTPHQTPRKAAPRVAAATPAPVKARKTAHVAAAVPTPARPTPAPSPRTPQPAPPSRVATAAPAPAPRASQPQTTTQPPRVAAATPPKQTPVATPALPTPAPQPITTTQPSHVVTAAPPPPAPAPAIATTTSTSVPVDTAAQTSGTTTTSTDTVTTSTDAFATATDTTATTTSSAPAPRPASGRGNLALRIFVVLIAIGLLVALFRASS